MKAMVLKEFCEIGKPGQARKRGDLPLKETPLEMAELPDPVPNAKEILVKVSACGVCHTELDEIEGRLVPPKFPIILGHEIVGRVEALGSGVTKFKVGDRVGIAWIYSSCGKCDFCLRVMRTYATSSRPPASMPMVATPSLLLSQKTLPTLSLRDSLIHRLLHFYALGSLATVP